jgi:hypothetical protein
MISTLEKRIDSVDTSVDGLVSKDMDALSNISDLGKDLAVLREQYEALNRWKLEIGSLVDVKTDLAVIKSDIVDLKKLKDQWGQRAWTFVSSLISLAAGALITYLVGK